MRTIYKYPLPIHDHIEIVMPEKACILKVECQGNTPCIWALIDPEAPPRTYHFRIFGTGHYIKEANLHHIATFQQGSFVWHLFE